MYYKLGQVYITNRGSFVTVGVALLFQIGASIVTNWGSYYKSGNRYYKIGQLLQIGAMFIKNCSRY